MDPLNVCIMHNVSYSEKKITCICRTCQSQLPATGGPVTRQRANQMKEKFDEYVRQRNTAELEVLDCILISIKITVKTQFKYFFRSL